MRSLTPLVVVFFVIVASALAPAGYAAPPQAATSGEASNAQLRATFTTPKGWRERRTAAMVVLTPPENDAHVAIVSVGAARDVEAAAASAWAVYHSSSHRTIQLIAVQPPRDGWDERQSINYTTSPNEHAIVQAMAQRKGSAWTVAILDGNAATFDKRGAAVALIAQSLRPPGYVRESLVGRKANSLTPDRLEAIKAFVRDSIAELGIPGAAVAIVERGQLVFEGGFGVRELGKSEPVDAHTEFMIASNTKGMSTLLLAKLVDDGKLRWDEPVIEVFPAFRLGSDATTQKVQIRHLVCACTGLPRKDFEWAFNTTRLTPATNTFALLSATEPTSGFGEVFQYNNLMAAASGYVAAHAIHPDLELGAAYDLAMRDLIFHPLGMNETTFDFDKALAGNHASPHAMDINGTETLLPMDFNYTAIPARPAGAAWSTAHDLIKYVQNELALGTLADGTQFVSSKNLLVRREPSVPMGESGFYGMGLAGERIGGVTAIHHGGSLMGFKSDVMLVPDANVGAVILTNADEGEALVHAFLKRLFEVLYNADPQAKADVHAAAVSGRSEVAKLKSDVTLPPTAKSVGEIADRYQSLELGILRVRKDNGRLYFDFGAWGTYVGSKTNPDRSISFVAIAPPFMGLDFVVDVRAGVRVLIVRDGQHEYIYSESK